MEDVASSSLDTVLDMVAVIAPLANAVDPRRCSMRQFNQARAGSPFPEAPTANAIHLAFNKGASSKVSWQRIVELAFERPTDREPVLRAAHRTAEQPWLTRRHLFYALNRVAQALGVETLTPAEYRQEREAIIRRERRRNADSEIAELLPTDGQIERIAANERAERGTGDESSDWDLALLLAGLTVRTERPARPRYRAASRRLPAAHGAAIYATINPTLPSEATLSQFAAEAGLQLATRPAGGWSKVLAAAAELLRDAGLPVPGGPKPLGRGGVLRFAVPAEPLGFDDLEPALTRAHAVEVLRAWDREQPGRRRGEREYQAWTAGTEHPSLHTLQKVAAFSELRTEALRLNSAGAPPRCALQSRDAATVSEDTLRAIAAGPTREIERAPQRGERKAVYRGPRPWLSHVIAAGLLSVDEQLVAVHRGARHTATFNADGDITVAGHPEPQPTVSHAKELVTGHKSGGWQFWTVERGGETVALSELRARLADVSGDHQPTPRSARAAA